MTAAEARNAVAEYEETLSDISVRIGEACVLFQEIYDISRKAEQSERDRIVRDALAFNLDSTLNQIDLELRAHA